MRKLSYVPSRTIVYLVYGAVYESLNPIPQAKHNVDALYNALIAPDIFGIPKSNIVRIGDQRNDIILSAIVQTYKEIQKARDHEIDTVVFYYAGHGSYQPFDKNLYLAAHNTNKDYLSRTAFSFEDVLTSLSGRGIQRKIFILDACYSGRAAEMKTENDTSFPFEQLNIKGSYLLTSSSAHEKSFFNADTTDGYTYFTAELLNFIQNGLPNTQPFVSLSALFNALTESTNLYSRPRKRNELIPEVDFLFYKNKMFNEDHADVLVAKGKFQQALALYENLRKYTNKASLDKKIRRCKEQAADEWFFAGEFRKALALYTELQLDLQGIDISQVDFQMVTLSDNPFTRSPLADKIKQCREEIFNELVDAADTLLNNGQSEKAFPLYTEAYSIRNDPEIYKKIKECQEKMATAGSYEGPAEILSFRTNYQQVYTGIEITLSWETNWAERVEIQPGIGEVASSGTTSVKIMASTNFILTAKNNYGSAVSKREVLVFETPSIKQFTVPLPEYATTINLSGIAISAPEINLSLDLPDSFYKNPDPKERSVVLRIINSLNRFDRSVFNLYHIYETLRRKFPK